MKYKVLLTDLIGTVYHDGEVYPEVPEVLQKLHDNGVKIIAVSAGNQEAREHRLKELGLLEYFDSVESSSKYGADKSELDLYSLVIKFLKLDPDECLVVGNNERNDVALPNASGLKTVKLSRGWDKILSTVGTHKIHDYSGLLKFFD